VHYRNLFEFTFLQSTVLIMFACLLVCMFCMFCLRFRTSHDSRNETMSHIKNRASNPAWPPVLVFPEGTCTNGNDSFGIDALILSQSLSLSQSLVLRRVFVSFGKKFVDFNRTFPQLNSILVSTSFNKKNNNLITTLIRSTGRGLITFRTGAFSTGQLVQPVCLRYPFKHLDTVCVKHGPQMPFLFFKMMCQFYNSVNVDFLEPIAPTEEVVPPSPKNLN
jgi:hypothetical protein